MKKRAKKIENRVHYVVRIHEGVKRERRKAPRRVPRRALRRKCGKKGSKNLGGDMEKMMKKVVLGLVLLVITGLMADAVAAIDTDDTQIEPLQGVGDVTTFVEGVGRTYHVFWGSKGGTDEYESWGMGWYTGGAGASCVCGGNAQDSCSIAIDDQSWTECDYSDSGGGGAASVYGTFGGTCDMYGNAYLTVEYHAACFCQ